MMEPRARPVATKDEALQRSRAGSRWAEAALVFALAGAAGTAAWCGSRGLDTALTGLPWDIWFEADCSRVVDNLTCFDSIQQRSAVHPLLALWLYPLAAGARVGFGLSPVLAVRALRAFTAAACLAVFYAVLRSAGCRRLDSVALAVLAGVSAGAVFWFAVPEVYPPGLLTMLLALELVAVGERRPLGAGWDVLANVATVSFTVTNWLAGLSGTFARWPWRRALLITGVVVCLTQFLMALQNQIFPSAALCPGPLDAELYVLHPLSGGPGRVLMSFFFHSVVMPDIATSARIAERVGLILTVQFSWPGSGGPWGVVAVATWSILLALGIYALVTLRGHKRLRAVLALTLAGQLVLHLLYGLETFNYACHFGPLLVLVAGMATLTRARRVALGLIAVLIVCAAVNNIGQFRHARAWVEQRAAQRQRAGPHGDSLKTYQKSAGGIF